MPDPADLTYEELCKEYDPIIHELIDIAQPEDSTIFAISGYPHYEDVISNWYAFFFDPSAEHSLGDLFLQSLIEIINEYKEFFMEDCSIKREFLTDKGGSIDLLFYEQSGEDGQFKSAKIIENKINAPLNNDLDDYFSSVKADQKAGIVLSLTSINDLPEKFINITHKRLLEVIQQNLGKYVVSAKPRYILYLQDFISNLEQLTGPKKMQDSTKYYFDNAKKIDNLLEIRKGAYIYIRDGFKVSAQNDRDWKWKDASNPADPKQYIKLVTLDEKILCRLDHTEIFREKSFILEIHLQEAQLKQTWQDIQPEDPIYTKFADKLMLKEDTVKSEYGLLIAEKDYPGATLELVENFGERVLEILREDWSEILEKVTEHPNQAIGHDTGA